MKGLPKSQSSSSFGSIVCSSCAHSTSSLCARSQWSHKYAKRVPVSHQRTIEDGAFASLLFCFVFLVHTQTRMRARSEISHQNWLIGCTLNTGSIYCPSAFVLSMSMTHKLMPRQSKHLTTNCKLNHSLKGQQRLRQTRRALRATHERRMGAKAWLCGC